MPWYVGNNGFFGMPMMNWIGGFIFILIWSLTLKGFALWFAAKRNEKPWYIILLIVNTMGLLELIYLLFVAKVFQETKKETRPPAHKKKR